MDAETEPGDRLIAYAVENLRLVDEGAHAVGSALAALAPGEALDAQARRGHQAIQAPLLRTLRELGAKDPEGVSELINALVHASTQQLEAGQPLQLVIDNLVTVLSPMAAQLQRAVSAQ